MPDREKVVTALECLADGQTCACCDYQPYDDCAKRVARDALALLEEQKHQIEYLEYSLGITESNLRHYINGND